MDFGVFRARQYPEQSEDPYSAISTGFHIWPLPSAIKHVARDLVVVVALSALVVSDDDQAFSLSSPYFGLVSVVDSLIGVLYGFLCSYYRCNTIQSHAIY